MASQTRWTWVWVNSESWWWTGRPGMLQFMGSQRVRHDWVTELNWTEFQFQVPGWDHLLKILQPWVITGWDFFFPGLLYTLKISAHKFWPIWLIQDSSPGDIQPCNGEVFTDSYWFFPCSALTHGVLHLVINKILIKYIKSPEFEHISHVKCIDLKIPPGDTGRIKIPQYKWTASFYSLTLTILRAFLLEQMLIIEPLVGCFIYNQL